MPFPRLHLELGMQDSERLSRVLPKISTLSDVLRPLAISLAQQIWEPREIRSHLKVRLPQSLIHLADPITRRLMHVFPGSASPDPAKIVNALKSTVSAQRLLDFARKSGSLPALIITEPTFLASKPFTNSSLPHLSVASDLETWLFLPPDQLTRFADLRGLSALTNNAFAPHYNRHCIPKSNGDLRLIEEPKPYLKRLQRRILHGLLSHIPVHPAACGFVQGRNAIEGASRHAGEAVVISFDLKDFFPSIPFSRIYSLFRTLGYPRTVALNLAGLTTTITPKHVLRLPKLAASDALSARHLPQGAPTSPALANLCALALDKRLSGLANALNASYTRYADDITFSGDAQIARVVLRAVPQIITEEGFILNPLKTRSMPSHMRQTVTGIIVNAHTNIARNDYDLLKATIHHLSRRDDPRRQDRVFLTLLLGQIGWVEQVHPQRGHRLRNALADALR
jgi:RNA-directed DNA polymerase